MDETTWWQLKEWICFVVAIVIIFGGALMLDWIEDHHEDETDS